MEVEKSTRVNGHSIKRLKELRDTITELYV